MKVFENMTREQEVLLTISMAFAFISVSLLVFTNVEKEVVYYFLGDNESIFSSFIVSFLFKTLLCLSFIIPWMASLCFCIRDNFINRRFC